MLQVRNTELYTTDSKLIEKEAFHASISFATIVYRRYAKSIGTYSQLTQKENRARRLRSVLNVASKPLEKMLS
jgi:hypothetical protein